MELSNFIKSPSTWSWSLAIYIFLTNAVKIVAILGPAIVLASITSVDNAFTISGFEKAFSECARGAARTMGLKESTVKPILIYSSIVALPYIASAPFIGLRKNWARILVILLLVADILVPLFAYIVESKGTVTFSTIFNIAVLIFLLLPSTVAEFKKVPLNEVT